MDIKIRGYDVERGDCFLIMIAEKINILVDGGRERSWGKLLEIINNRNEKKEINGIDDIDGIVVTHIDDDHIGGILKLLKNDLFKNRLKSNEPFFIIFNDLVNPATISYKQGKHLKQVIDSYKNIQLVNSYSNNHKFNIKGMNIFIKMVDNNLKHINENYDSIVINILSPSKEILRELMKNWQSEKRNDKITNKSSIVFLLKYRNKNILMTGDSSIKIFCEPLNNLKGVKKIDLIKLPHHGAETGNNEGIEELIDKYKCERVILSSKRDSSKIVDKFDGKVKVEKTFENKGKGYIDIIL